MKRIEIAVLIGIITAIILSSYTAFAGECEEVREQVLRLHILANSNTEEDQALKLAVRDAVLEGTQELFTGMSAKEETQAVTEEHLQEIQLIARQEVERQGYDYTVRAMVVNMYFETRQYGDTILPAGQYDAVRILIGEGEGNNWWCVMFPPMCIPAASDSTQSADIQQQIESLGQQPQYQPKFAVVELWEGLRDKFSGQEEVLALA